MYVTNVVELSIEIVELNIKVVEHNIKVVELNIEAIELNIEAVQRPKEVRGRTRCKVASNLLFIQFWNNDYPQNYKYWKWGKILHFEKNQIHP